MSDGNHCITCGACCAHFRVSFYFGESNSQPGGTVPSELVEAITPFRVAMKGTNQPEIKCIALEGEVGKLVSCSIYESRSTTCRHLEVGSENCNTARIAWGMEPLHI